LGETQHQVTLTKDFYIGVFEVTQKQWELVMSNWPSCFNNIDVREVRPVEQVSYNDIRGSTTGAGWPVNSNVDATSFMGKLRQKTGIEAFDLPTEAQWE
jgi:formylglycine-generating enzyme required for sulfatase activity